MENWIDYVDDSNNLVLSSRIRLARNIEGYEFPHKLSVERARAVIKSVEKSFDNNGLKLNTINMWESTMEDNYAYFEKHLISIRLVDNREKAAFLKNDDETISVMVNEEDHIRLQCITAGLNLEEAFKVADDLDNKLEKDINYSFDENLGYLTACPTNLGTGLRASVMLHLPALSHSEKIKPILNKLQKMGIAIRGLYGEGSMALGNIYQISNEVSIGVTEDCIIEKLNNITNKIISMEMIERDKFLYRYKDEVEDKVWRALGILKSARIISSKECLNLLSNVRFGVELGIIKDIPINKLNHILVYARPSNIQNTFKDINKKNIDLNRASLIREILN